jgi:hypothetical protein
VKERIPVETVPPRFPSVRRTARGSESCTFLRGFLHLILQAHWLDRIHLVATRITF